MKDVWPLLKNTDFPPVSRRAIEILQVNLGYLCNQSCLHCHVAAGPNRKELMTDNSINDLLKILKQPLVHTLDLTGGAPEMNPLFKDLVVKARELDVKVIDRCNLTILCEPGYENMAQFLADHEVQIVASLPCYIAANVDGQRGKGVYQKSIEALQTLNQLGYSQPGSNLTISLVYNPTEPLLPPSQAALEADYKQFLQAEFDIQFDQLLTITNMPIARFGSTLISKGEFNHYMTLLKDAYNASNLDNLMCRNQLSVDWRGFIYDCDFNQMLNMNIANPHTREPLHIRDLMLDDLFDIPVRVADHCYGCTAGQGSSCGGALGY